MDPVLFGRDIERTPETLRELASVLRSTNPWADLLGNFGAGRRLVLVGMGSSHFANSVLATRLQAKGVHAIASLASGDPLPHVDSTDVVIAVSASGGSVETINTIRHFSGRCSTIAVTNAKDSEIEEACDAHVAMLAGPEVGGVACRSFAHNLGLHLALEQVVTGGVDAPTVIEAAADAIADLLARRNEWIEPLKLLLLGPDGTAFVAPAGRLSSAQHSALMVREGPRLPAIACETGDWSHIDVYLTKTTDYRMMLFSGSVWEEQLLGWCRKRGSTVVVVGGEADGAAYTLRYRSDDVDDVRLIADPVVAEWLAHVVWAGGSL